MASTMQLDFLQAMSDFTTMFPDMDRDVIEAVLRCNKGAVDATIDQLLAMSTDNQNEKLRNELDEPDGRPRNSTTSKSSPINTPIRVQPSASVAGMTVDHRATTTTTTSTSSQLPQLLTGIGPGAVTPTVAGSSTNLGASPKVKQSTSPRAAAAAATTTNTTFTSASSRISNTQPPVIPSKWNPPMLLPLPATFLRLPAGGASKEQDFPDEQFAMMLQNEEFMNELRWNHEFMLALEKEQQDKSGKGDDDAAFKERLKHMGKKSRKKFQQLAKVFTWQKNKKPAVRHPDSLLLQEEHSDDDDDLRRRPRK